MPKNMADAVLHRIFQTTFQNHKRLLRTGRTNQISPLGYFPLVNGLSTIVETATVPDGAMYYAIDLHHIRAFVNGSWVTVV